jgi:glycerol uptake facilitator-like aquaporin
MASARRTLFGELCAEFAGTLILILILFGVGVAAQVVTSHGAFGDHDSIAWGWGLGVVLGIYTAARVSAAHLNPAVTLALAVFRGFEWRKVLPFCAAQMLGAFVAALIVRAAYGEAIGARSPTRAEPCTSGCRSWVRWSAGCSALSPMSGSSSVSCPEATSPRKSVRSRGRRRICRATAETHDRERRAAERLDAAVSEPTQNT